MNTQNKHDGTSPPSTPPSSPISSSNGEFNADRINLSHDQDSTAPTPTSPPSPYSAVSAISQSAVSATVSRSQFDMSSSVDVTQTPRFQGTELTQDIVSTPRRSNLPRGDLGRSEFKMSKTPSLYSSSSSRPPQSPGASSVSSSRGDLPDAPPSPPSSPGSTNTSLLLDNSDMPPPFSPSQMEENREEEYSTAVIWGTNVNLAETMHVFRSFIQEFRFNGDITEEPYYIRVLNQMFQTQVYVLNLDSRHLLQYSLTKKLYDQLIRFPQVLIRILDMVIKEEFERLHGVPEVDLRVQVRVFNLRDVQPMRNLNPSDIDQLVCLKGMVIRCSQVIPDLKLAFFQCSVCKASKEVPLDRGRIEEPTICEICETRGTMNIIHNRCSFTDKQMIKVQETPDAVPEGETPHTVTLFAFDDLVDGIRPGDKVEVTGIFRAVPMRLTQKQRVVKSVFKTYIDVIHFNTIDNLKKGNHGHDDMGNESNNVEQIRMQKIEEFKRLAEAPDIYEILAQSVAPSIWELDDVKKGILCQLFGGCDKTDAGAPSGKFRADINVLLCGDPGTSKSQLLSYVHKIAPRGIYTSGKGSSAVGLTASVVRDPEAGDLVLESGALVLSDQGICCIDEFDKMSDSARSVLHEVMEQQTVSIAKAGIICSLNARTSILASANPIESRYNPRKSVVENINILPTLLSRFDLIYLILDKANPDSDRRLAKHIVSMYFETPTASPPPISMKFLSEYIDYAKKEIHPKITDEATRDLIQGYLDMRRMGGNKKCITATPRQLESLIRLAEAHARLHLSTQVTRRNVMEAIRLINVATQKAAMDPRTGTIDMDMITTGHTAMDRESFKRLIETMKEMINEKKNNTNQLTLNILDIRKELETEKKIQFKDDEFQRALSSLTDETVIQVIHSKIRIL